MAISKIILNGEVQMDVTSDTAAESNMLSGIKATKNDGTKVTGTIASKSSSDLTVSGATVTAPAGYYLNAASKSVASGSAKTPATTITANPTVSIDSDGLITATVSASKSITPTVSTGYVSSGTAGTVTVSGSGTKQLDTKASSDLTANGATVTAPAGYYSTNASKSVTTMTLPTTTATSAASGYTSKATIDRNTADRYLNIPPGYNSSGGYYKISKVANGSVTAPSSISGTSATVSTGTNTLTLTKSVSVTPSVTTAGYISSGTAGNSSVSLTASVTTKGAATITPSTSEQSIAAGTYLTGKQTIAAMPSGTAGTPTATKGTVSNHSVTVTPSVTNTTGYITGGTKTGTAVTVSASELASGNKAITENGTGIDVTNYASVDVNVASNVTPLTVTPSNEVQVFDGSYAVKNLGDLNQYTSSSSGNTLTKTIDLSEIEYGKTYHISCDYIVASNFSQYDSIISIDTDWVAAENASIPFTYISHQGSWDINSITMSKTTMKVMFSSNYGGLSFRNYSYDPNTVHDFIITAKSDIDGYMPVTVAAATGDFSTAEITITNNSPQDLSFYVAMNTESDGTNPAASFVDWAMSPNSTDTRQVILYKGNAVLVFYDEYCQLSSATGNITLYNDRAALISGDGSITVTGELRPAASLSYGTFTVVANNSTTAQYIGYISMCPFQDYATNYYPAYVSTALDGGVGSNINKGRWVINPADGFMYVTFVGGNDSYTPVITSTSGFAARVTSIRSGEAIENKNHYAKTMVVYKVSDGAVLTASYVNNN